MSKFVSKVYFTLDDLHGNETKDSKISEVKEKIEQSLFEALIKNKVWFTVNEHGEEVEIEGILNIKEDAGNVPNDEVFHSIRRTHENDDINELAKKIIDGVKNLEKRQGI